MEVPKDLLFELLSSHSNLAAAEYKRNKSYNDSHFSHKIETKMTSFLEEKDLMVEMFKIMELKDKGNTLKIIIESN